MSEKTILVIDDSSTIRRLVDSQLGNDGYRVVMAANAEDGLELAADEHPDLILLDHQLPGTTGFDVCCKLMGDEQLREIPVVVSSTLRKKAYVEYTDQPNVIDMLPKPYTPDLLRTTVANAIETSSMVVQSQSNGTAVPEVINAQDEAELDGSFQHFSVREVIDFLNNCEKCGRLEIDLGRSRVSVFLDQGRIQAVTASGVAPAVVSENLPELIADLGPMVKFTVGGQSSSQVDGLVELLNNEVLDSRLLKQLLRHQACVLLRYCVDNKPQTFRFEFNKKPSSLFGRLPLDVSLIALFVESWSADNTIPTGDELLGISFIRTMKRGENLDRTGLSARHAKLLNQLGNTGNGVSVATMTTASGLDSSEVFRAMKALQYLQIVKPLNAEPANYVIGLTANPQRAKQLTSAFRANDDLSGRAVRDLLAVKLLLRRQKPGVLVFDLDDATTSETIAQLRAEHEELQQAVWIGLTSSSLSLDSEPMGLDRVCSWPDSIEQLVDVITEQPAEKQLQSA